MLSEAIVALVIAAVGLAALFTSVGSGATASALADRQRAATAVAQSMIAELQRADAIADGVSEGDTSAGQHWRLELERLKTTAEDRRGALEGHTVKLTISWRQEGRPRSLDFQTLLLKRTP